MVGVLAVLAASGPGCTATSGGYLTHVTEGITALEKGSTQDGVAALGLAVSIRPDHPLAHAAMGYALLAGGWSKQAEEQFEAAYQIDESCAAAIYGKGLVSLGKRQFGQAASFFEQAREVASPSQDSAGAIAYARAMAAGGKCRVESGEPGAADDACRAVEAFGLMREGHLADAGVVLKRLHEEIAKPVGGVVAGFGKRPGCLMTFVDDAPLVFGSARLAKPYKPATKRTGPRTVKGTIHLQADLSKARSVKLVSFLIDDRLLGVTNCSPFQCSWNTANWENGTHTVKITGVDDLGTIVSEKTTTVLVVNPAKTPPSPSLTGGGDGCSEQWTRLWELMRLRPSPLQVDYNLGVCAQAGGDVNTAMAAFERVMAVDPDCLDTASRLKKLYASGPQPDLYKIDTNVKVVAITFDDGPKPDTARLLDALREKNVRATFFVVGKQVEKYPDLLKRIHDEGHEIQNHTYSHGDLEMLSAREIEKELFRNAVVVRSITGRTMRMMRPPGAHRGKRLQDITRKFGIRQVLWTANCSKLEGTTKEKVASYVLSKTKPGAVVLMHNLDRVTLNALPGIVDELRRKGYEFATLTELARMDSKAAKGGVSVTETR